MLEILKVDYNLDGYHQEVLIKLNYIFYMLVLLKE